MIISEHFSPVFHKNMLLVLIDTASPRQFRVFPGTQISVFCRILNANVPHFAWQCAHMGAILHFLSTIQFSVKFREQMLESAPCSGL